MKNEKPSHTSSAATSSSPLAIDKHCAITKKQKITGSNARAHFKTVSLSWDLPTPPRDEPAVARIRIYAHTQRTQCLAGFRTHQLSSCLQLLEYNASNESSCDSLSGSASKANTYHKTMSLNLKHSCDTPSLTADLFLTGSLQWTAAPGCRSWSINWWDQHLGAEHQSPANKCNDVDKNVSMLMLGFLVCFILPSSFSAVSFEPQ